MTNSTASLSAWRGRMGHTVLFAGLSLATVAMAILFGRGETVHHLVLLLILLPFCGIPHGALDYALAGSLCRRRCGRWWGPGFVALYLLVMFIVITVWFYQATFSLAAFLALTWYHFSTGDALTGPRTPLLLRISEGMARGGLILCLPAVFDRTEVQRLLAYLAPEAGVALLLDILAAMAPLCVMAAAGGVAASMVAFVRQRTAIDLARAVELVILTLMFMLLPALLAFTIHFNFLHSVRHMLAIGTPLPASSALRVWARMLVISLPVTLATLLLGAFAYAVSGGVSFDTAHLMRIVFIGIAAMTYPHVIVVFLAATRGPSSRSSAAGRTASSPVGQPNTLGAGP